jgi:hypothetical protein
VVGVGSFVEVVSDQSQTDADGQEAAHSSAILCPKLLAKVRRAFRINGLVDRAPGIMDGTYCPVEVDADSTDSVLCF